jgi:hypothetical protein
MNRREFHRIVGFAVLVSSSLGGIAEGNEATTTSDAGPQHKPTLRITHGKAHLVSPLTTPAGEVWKYGVSFPFQVSPTEAGLFTNVRGSRGLDYEVGNDIIIFDNLSDIDLKRAVIASRNAIEPNPNGIPKGSPAMMGWYETMGGFVPLGAKRDDGSPHPHAGTGFGIGMALAWPVKGLGPYKRADLAAALSRYDGGGSYDRQALFGSPDQSYMYHELQQYRYDGKTFQITSKERFFATEWIPGWDLFNRGFSTAIPDGDDLLLPMSGKPVAKGQQSHYGWKTNVAGLLRWRRGDQGWRPVEFHPATGPVGLIEPTVVRDVDGSLLLCGRTLFDIRVWRSADSGRTWKKVIEQKGAVASAPITINQAVDGTPFIVANLYFVPMNEIGAEYQDALSDSLNQKTGTANPGYQREKQCLWILNKQRNGLECPILARDCRAEFGAPPSGYFWAVDHALGKTVRLADGKWHHVLASRIEDFGQVLFGLESAPQAGSYLEEVISEGPPVPSWNF